jgi:esterase FrsA
MPQEGSRPSLFRVRRHTRPLAELWPLWKDRAAAGTHPFQFTLSDVVERVVTSLGSYDRDAWAEAFSAAAAPYRTAAEDAEQAGDIATAQRNYLRAYGCYRLARYPTTNSGAKFAAHRQSQDMLLRASRYFTVPIERVEIPFRGRAGEGDRVVGYLRIPGSDRRLPILIVSGGIDTFKEDIPRDGVLDRGIATLALDIPGVGDAPLAGSTNAERMFDAVLDWIGRQPRLDAERVGYWGASTGGYWAVKVAHTHRDRLACVVSHGGCVHHAFEPAWIEAAQWGEYPFELAETLAYAFGYNPSTIGWNTPRSSRCCGRASWINLAPRHCWSTACTTRCSRSATAICYSSMERRNPPASSMPHTWATPVTPTPRSSTGLPVACISRRKPA